VRCLAGRAPPPARCLLALLLAPCGQAELDALKKENAEYTATVADLRKEIQDTKSALDEDGEALETHVRSKQQALERVRLSSAQGAGGGRVRLGAAVGGRLPLPSAKEDVAAKESGAVTVGGIAALKRELAALKAKYAVSEETIAQLRSQSQQHLLEISTLTSQISTLTTKLTTVQTSYTSLQALYEPCPGLISSLQEQIRTMTAELSHRSNLCGVGLRISQFDPRDLQGKSALELHNADGKVTTDDHGGGVWVSKVIPGGPAAINGLIQPNDQLVKIDGKPLESVTSAAKYLRGAPDTTVTLTLQAPSRNTYTVELVRALSRTAEQAVKYLEKDTSTPRKELPPLYSSLYSSQMSGVSDGLYTSRSSVSGATDLYGSRPSSVRFGGNTFYGSTGISSLALSAV